MFQEKFTLAKFQGGKACLHGCRQEGFMTERTVLTPEFNQHNRICGNEFRLSSFRKKKKKKKQEPIVNYKLLSQ